MKVIKKAKPNHTKQKRKRETRTKRKRRLAPALLQLLILQCASNLKARPRGEVKCPAWGFTGSFTSLVAPHRPLPAWKAEVRDIKIDRIVHARVVPSAKRAFPLAHFFNSQLGSLQPSWMGSMRNPAWAGAGSFAGSI